MLGNKVSGTLSSVVLTRGDPWIPAESLNLVGNSKMLVAVNQQY